MRHREACLKITQKAEARLKEALSFKNAKETDHSHSLNVSNSCESGAGSGVTRGCCPSGSRGQEGPVHPAAPKQQGGEGWGCYSRALLNAPPPEVWNRTCDMETPRSHDTEPNCYHVAKETDTSRERQSTVIRPNVNPVLTADTGLAGHPHGPGGQAESTDAGTAGQGLRPRRPPPGPLVSQERIKGLRARHGRSLLTFTSFLFPCDLVRQGPWALWQR